MTSRATQVCIVGAGPRGLSVLERLCANARRLPGRSTAAPHLLVHVVDPCAPGAGRVWRTEQPAELLMNTVSSQITLFTDDSVRIDGPIERGPSLYEWAASVASGQTGRDLPPAVLAEARALGPDDYSTRSFYGHYLAACFDRVVAGAPAHVRVVTHATLAVALDDGDRPGDAFDGDRPRQTVRLADGTVLADLDAVVLAQGHLPSRPSAAQARTARLARTHGLTYLPPANPADLDLSALEPGTGVLLRGMGLNFFDYMALLSTGRGGRFVPDRTAGPGALAYLPSGAEPHLFAFSRRGVPYQARGENEKGAAGRHLPRLLTVELVERLRADPQRPLRFREDLWPLIRREVETVFYGTLLDQFGRSDERADLELRYLALADDAGTSALLDEVGIDPALRFDWDRVLHPLRGLTFPDRTAFNDWVLRYLDADAREARRGNVSGPLKAALDVLRDLRNEIRLAVDHGGLDGASHQQELQGWYTPVNAFLSIGPPARRIEEMAALVRAGVLRLTGPDTRVDLDVREHCFVARSAAVPDVPVRTRVLVEARMPEPDLRRTGDALLLDLLDRGQCRPFAIRGASGTRHETGALAVTARPYRLTDVDGRVHPRRFAYGVPTEGVHWVTAAGIRPGVDSVTLGDSDAIARAVLGQDAPAGQPAVVARPLAELPA